MYSVFAILPQAQYTILVELIRTSELLEKFNGFWSCGLRRLDQSLAFSGSVSNDPPRPGVGVISLT